MKYISIYRDTPLLLTIISVQKSCTSCMPVLEHFVLYPAYGVKVISIDINPPCLTLNISSKLSLDYIHSQIYLTFIIIIENKSNSVGSLNKISLS